MKIDFDLKMLRWKKGFYKTDGIWCQHWYDNVINTTHFETKAFKEKLPKEYEKFIIILCQYMNQCLNLQKNSLLLFF